MDQFILIIGNDLRKAVKQKYVQYLLISCVLLQTVPMLLIVSNSQLLFQLSKSGSYDSLFASFYLGQYAFISSLGIIITNLVLFFMLSNERDNNMWKFLLSLPVPPEFYVFAKLSAALLLNLGLVTILFLQTLLEGAILSYMLPNTQFIEFGKSLLVLGVFLSKFYLIATAATCFHLLIHFYLRNRALLLLLSVFTPIICLYDFMSYLPYGWAMSNFWLGKKIENGMRLSDSLIGRYEVMSIIFLLLTALLITAFKNKIYKYSNFFK